MENARGADGRIRVLRHSRRAGQSAALWTGFRASRGSTILTLDGDMQNDPADLPRLLAELTDCDLVCGMRSKRMDNWLRRFSSAVARITRRLVLKADFRDTGCNLRAFKRSVLETIPPFNGFHRFLPILAQRGGAAVKEIPVAHHPRFAGKANYGIGNRLGRGIYDVIMVRWYLKRHFLPVTTFENPRPEPTGPGAIPPSRSAE
jgi:dolichol-phosphate mannosyltransferase